MDFPAAACRLIRHVAAPAIFAFLAFIGAAAAQQAPVCPKPPMPACIDDLTTFVSADRMIACQSAVKDYIDDTMWYLNCRKDGDVATNAELMSAVNRFNCRLSGGETCG